jgi:hypothetical protein
MKEMMSIAYEEETDVKTVAFCTSNVITVEPNASIIER